MENKSSNPISSIRPFRSSFKMSNLNQCITRILTNSESALKDSESARTFLNITLNRFKVILVSDVCCPYVSQFPPPQTAAPSFDSCTPQTVPLSFPLSRPHRSHNPPVPSTLTYCQTLPVQFFHPPRLSIIFSKNSH